MSSLSITFSADGTTLYAADDDGIWQFKTVASLAGVDQRLADRAERPAEPGRPLRRPGQRRGGHRHRRRRLLDAVPGPGRRRARTSITGGPGNDDTAVFGNFADDRQRRRHRRPAAAAPTAARPAAPFDGHGTPVAGVVAQFVPQATIVPVNIFAPFLAPASTSTTTAAPAATAAATGGTDGHGATPTP